MLRLAVSEGKVVAGICSACVTLAKAGILKGKRATVYPGDAQTFTPFVGEYTASDVEQDGLLITANGPGAAEKFGTAVLELINQS